MSRPIARYRPSRRYAIFAALALFTSVLSAALSTYWGLPWMLAAALLGLTSLFTLFIALRPAIEIHGTHLIIGKRIVFWNEVQRLDRISVLNREPWAAPLLLRLTLQQQDGIATREVLLFHPGDLDSCISLLRTMYRSASSALLDGTPYSQFWGELPVVKPPATLPGPRLLSAEDEEEVERLFQRLKVAGRLDGTDEI